MDRTLPLRTPRLTMTLPHEWGALARLIIAFAIWRAVGLILRPLLISKQPLVQCRVVMESNVVQAFTATLVVKEPLTADREILLNRILAALVIFEDEGLWRNMFPQATLPYRALAMTVTTRPRVTIRRA